MNSGKKVVFARTNALFHTYKSSDTPGCKDKQTSATKFKAISSQNGEDTPFVPPTPRSIMKKTTLRRSHSAASIATPRRDLINAETPVKTSPVTHYCSPRSVRRKLNTDSGQSKSVRVPSTPECFNKVHLETPSAPRSQPAQNILLSEEASHLTVAVRVRPLNNKEEFEVGINKIVLTDGNEVRVLCESNSCHNFTYDHVFSATDSQEVVFSTFVQPLLDNAFRGYNACLFAYGQTGSGKSYSMMGVNFESSTVCNEAGIIPRFTHELFERVASLEDSQVPGVQEKCSAKIEVSYFEIYNEKIHDLLNNGESSGKRGNALKVREHPIFGPYVVDLTVHEVSSFEDVQGLLSVGTNQRASASTAMNDESSRSHSIFSIILSQSQFEDSGIEGVQNELSRCSKISLVDLAGSERIAQSCTSVDRLREGVHINKSLLTLGKVITALAEAGCSKKKIFIPYRDSVLTWLLRESLGGNSRTSMLATISPANIHLEETLATLRYACQAKNIVNTVRVNEDPKDRIIRELRSELQKLKTAKVSSTTSNDSLKIRLLQEKLTMAQEKLAELETMEQRKHEEQVEEIEEIKLKSQIELWKKVEEEKEVVEKAKQQYESEIGKKLEEQKKEIEKIKQKSQTELNRKLEELKEQLQQKSEMDLSRKLEDQRKQFEQELKRISSCLDNESSRNEMYRKDLKKLEKQVQNLQIELDSKTKLVKELSRFEDEGFDECLVQTNDYDSLINELMRRLQILTSVLASASDGNNDEKTLEGELLKSPFESLSSNVKKNWLEHAEMSSVRHSIPANVTSSPTRASIRILPMKKTVRFQDVSSL